MTRDQILSKLCWYDPRNPNSDGTERPENCSCDNCFYGRHALADILLALEAEVAELREAMPNGEERYCLGSVVDECIRYGRETYAGRIDAWLDRVDAVRKPAP